MKLFLPKPSLSIPLFVSFALCISFAANAQTVDYGKSFINLTKGNAGGTIEPGDTLQIRATFVVKSGTLDSCAFFDNVPTGTSYIPGSLAVLTNEGKIYKAFTDAAGDDCGWISGSAISMYLGYNTAAGKQASPFRRGQIKNSDKPSFYNGTCIMVASYKVKITAPLSSQINLGGGSVTYKNGSSSITTMPFPADKVAIFTNYGLCANAVGANAIGTESNGTFGSGKNKDRGTSANIPPTYTYATFSNNNPNDYYYGVSNNTSTNGAGYSILNSWGKPDPSATSHRVFGVWDIIGDHTGAVNAALGNPPADTVNKNNGGYMLVINASYRIDSAFYQTVSGLCPNTYYEFSVWIRNICSKCGCDSNGKGATGGAGYIPTALGDSSGVKPNLTLAINGADYYTTGDIAYNGQWVKKGFTYLTGPLQTSITAMIRNNAPGGGGNDWAIDDIALATCSPNLTLNPSPNITVCVGNQVDINSVIRCYFANYVYWQYEKSTDNGVTWLPSGVSGIGSPTLVGGQWQYTATYPSFLASAGMNNTRYRIKIASTPTSLSDPNCSYTAATTLTVLTSTCSALPGNQLKYSKGKLVNTTANIEWATASESPEVYFEIEKSTDAIHFDKIGSANGLGQVTNDEQTYLFVDNTPLIAASYYRIKMITGTGYVYGRMITVYPGNIAFDVKSLINPFDNSISFEAIAPIDMAANIMLFDSFGKLVLQKHETLYRGGNKILLAAPGALNDGTYFLRIQANDYSVNKKLVKIKN